MYTCKLCGSDTGTIAGPGKERWYRIADTGEGPFCSLLCRHRAGFLRYLQAQGEMSEPDTGGPVPWAEIEPVQLPPAESDAFRRRTCPDCQHPTPARRGVRWGRCEKCEHIFSL